MIGAWNELKSFESYSWSHFNVPSIVVDMITAVWVVMVLYLAVSYARKVIRSLSQNKTTHPKQIHTKNVYKLNRVS